MTLGRLVFAWLLVVVVFVVVGGVGIRFRNVDPSKPGGHWDFTKRDMMWRALEAAFATLFGSLWFDSLGSGGWWLLFLLVGLMVSAARMQGAGLVVADPVTRAQVRRDHVARTVRDVVRYVLAGAVLAWRLG